MPSQTQPFRRFASRLLCAAAATLALPAVGDSLQRGELPLVDNVILIGVEDGQLQYRSGAGAELTVPLNEVNTIAIDDVPQFATGLAAFKEGQMRAAVNSFQDIWTNTNRDWVRHYAGFYLTQAFDQRNQPVEAAQIWATMVAQSADRHFLSVPPVTSIREAGEDQKERIVALLRSVIEDADADIRPVVAGVISRALGEEIDIPDSPTAGTGTAVDIEGSAVVLPQAVWGLLERPNEGQKWAAVAMLSRGEFAEAIEAMTPWLNEAREVPEKLFIVGRAQLALADAMQQTDEAAARDLYRDAGLTFMRIVVHYGDIPGRDDHVLVPCAKVEVAYVHRMIGREDIFRQVMVGGDGGVGVNLVIDDEDAYPYYSQRFRALMQQEPPGGE